MSAEPHKIPVANGERSMKPMLGELVQEAVKLALIDSCLPADQTHNDYGVWSDAEKAEFQYDIHKLPADALAGMDPSALAQNVACRLLGTGGWFIGEMYTGNATAREVFDATFARPDHDVVSEVAFDLKRAMDEEASDGE